MFVIFKLSIEKFAFRRRHYIHYLLFYSYALLRALLFIFFFGTIFFQLILWQIKIFLVLQKNKKTEKNTTISLPFSYSLVCRHLHIIDVTTLHHVFTLIENVIPPSGSIFGQLCCYLFCFNAQFAVQVEWCHVMDVTKLVLQV